MLGHINVLLIFHDRFYNEFISGIPSIMNVESFNEIIKQLVKDGFISKNNSIVSIAITVFLLPIIIKIGFLHDKLINDYDNNK